jgi:CubicO group peptidase (beta-lactamase class C family)
MVNVHWIKAVPGMGVFRMRMSRVSECSLIALSFALAAAMLGAQGLSGRVEPMSERHLAQINRFRTAPPTARLVTQGEHPLPLPERLQSLASVRYRVGDQSYSLDDFLSRTHVAGFLVLKDGEIVDERYGLGNTKDSVWISYSMAKSVVSLLYGAAILDGYIANLDAKVTDYLPPLKSSSYEGVTIRHLLQMASGVQWNEDYADPNSDVGNYPGGNVVRLLEFLGAKPRVAPPGTRFNYSTGETDLAGVVLRAAIGNNLATYLAHKIWTPMMESPAYWATHGAGGGERGGCCLYATLRDYGRLAQFVLDDGVRTDGTRVLPPGWIHESTTPSPASKGYGYLWWLGDDHTFRAAGIYGQGIYFNPAKNLAIVVLSAWTAASDREASTHRAAAYAAIDTYVH